MAAKARAAPAIVRRAGGPGQPAGELEWQDASF